MLQVERKVSTLFFPCAVAVLLSKNWRLRLALRYPRVLQKISVFRPHLSSEIQNMREIMGKHAVFHFHDFGIS